MSNEKDSIIGFLQPLRITSLLKPHQRHKQSLFLAKSKIQSPLHSSVANPYATEAKSFNQSLVHEAHGFTEADRSDQSLQSKRLLFRQFKTNEIPSQHKASHDSSLAGRFEDKLITKDSAAQDPVFVSIDDSRLSHTNKSQNKNEEIHISKTGALGTIKTNSNRLQGWFGSGQQEERKKQSAVKAVRSTVSADPNSMLVSSNPEIASLQLNELLRRLRAIKVELENEVEQLSVILNHTEKYLDNTSKHSSDNKGVDDTSKCQSFLDEEYARIKNNILDYTSRSLDTAYSRYKENMEWAKYEAEEKKGENFVADLNRLLAEEERGLNAFLSKPVIALSKLKDKMQALQRQIINYEGAAKDIRFAKEECLARRPILSLEKIKDFETALIALASF